MATSIKNILIGIFVISAIGIIIFMLLFLHPSVGDNAKTLHVLFTDIDKVTVGTRVTFAGKPVGEVVSIEEIPDARTKRLDVHGDVYVYELVLNVDSGVDVFNTDIISLRTSGLLGERNIEINPRPLLPGEKLIKVEDHILYAAATESVEDAMKQFGELSKKFSVVLDDLHFLFQEIKSHEIVAKTGKSINNVLEITTTLNQPGKLRQIVDQAGRTVDNFHDLSLSAKRSWESIDLTINDLHQSARNVVSFTERANQIIDYTASGQGTLGQLFVGDELFLRMKSLLHKGEVVMDDINSYGILFHLDKRWQRQQGRRLRLLEKLNNPNEFTKYFNQEMDQISSSLSRVSLVLNESEYYPQCFMANPQFIHRFAELMRRVGTMEETLKLYNEQVIEQSHPDTCPNLWE